mmetsp:Transcript_10343/g.27407  ORF Transcript_10343/g.27407 Transcript_10343/m.27407 type:complete len:206 (+) Transcript_10343:3543-4160(+)
MPTRPRTSCYGLQMWPKPNASSAPRRLVFLVRERLAGARTGARIRSSISRARRPSARSARRSFASRVNRSGTTGPAPPPRARSTKRYGAVTGSAVPAVRRLLRRRRSAAGVLREYAIDATHNHSLIGVRPHAVPVRNALLLQLRRARPWLPDEVHAAARLRPGRGQATGQPHQPRRRLLGDASAAARHQGLRAPLKIKLIYVTTR